MGCRSPFLASLAVAEVLLPWAGAGRDNALGNGQAPGWLAWIPGTPSSPERLLITAVVAGLLIQIGHQAVLMLHPPLQPHRAPDHA